MAGKLISTDAEPRHRNKWAEIGTEILADKLRQRPFNQRIGRVPCSAVQRESKCAPRFIHKTHFTVCACVEDNSRRYVERDDGQMSV